MTMWIISILTIDCWNLQQPEVSLSLRRLPRQPRPVLRGDHWLHLIIHSDGFLGHQCTLPQKRPWWGKTQKKCHRHASHLNVLLWCSLFTISSQVLFLGKIKASHKRAPPSFIGILQVRYKSSKSESNLENPPSLRHIWENFTICLPQTRRSSNSSGGRQKRKRWARSNLIRQFSHLKGKPWGPWWSLKSRNCGSEFETWGKDFLSCAAFDFLFWRILGLLTQNVLCTKNVGLFLQKMWIMFVSSLGIGSINLCTLIW